MESLPYKFESRRKVRKSNSVNKPTVYEPMTNGELAKALNISELELAQAFGYDEDGPTQAYNDDVDFT